MTTGERGSTCLSLTPVLRKSELERERERERESLFSGPGGE